MYGRLGGRPEEGLGPRQRVWLVIVGDGPTAVCSACPCPTPCPLDDGSDLSPRVQRRHLYFRKLFLSLWLGFLLLLLQALAELYVLHH